MSRLPEVLASVDGLREDAARRIERRFDSVAALAGASEEDIEQIRGVGRVMSGRVLSAAMAAQSRVADPARAAKDANARTAATADRVIDTAGRVAGATIGRTSEGAREALDDAEVTARTGVYRLHATGDETVDRAAGAVEDTTALARSAADRAVGTARGLAGQALEVTGAVARSTFGSARALASGLLGRRTGGDD